MQRFSIDSDKTKLIAVLCTLLAIGFLATTLVSYYVSRNAIRESIRTTELPLTSDNVYSEIQKDLVRPILISSMMARDTFLRDWVIAGERDTERMTRYLNEVMSYYGAVTCFFVSDTTRTYYSTEGILKTVRLDEPRDIWYFRVRDMKAPYEINVDPDLAHRDRMTIFLNFRVLDFEKRFIGATGVGLTVDTVTRLIDDYQQRYGRTIFLTDDKGQITVAGREKIPAAAGVAPNIHALPGLGEQADSALRAGTGTFEYLANGQRHFANVRYIPELKWHLFVIKSEDHALDNIQHTLYINLLLCLIITLIVALIVHLAVNHYQRRVETMATTDGLTGLANRHALDILLAQQIRDSTRQGRPLSAIMLDIDHFKALNDSRGHLAGDHILRSIADTLKAKLRASDIACRWGGEEFLIVLNNTTQDSAIQVAHDLCRHIEQGRYAFAGTPIPATVSAGVASYRADETPETFVARTDALLYQAKQAGRNRVCSETGEAV